MVRSLMICSVNSSRAGGKRMLRVCWIQPEERGRLGGSNHFG
jgi:hypothetical protein